MYLIFGNAFLGFQKKVAEILTNLTTLDNKIPQGAPTSPGLSNLVLWLDESLLAKKMLAMGLTYTRYGDDITISSAKKLTDQYKRYIISLLYGMLFKNGLKPKREKHKIYNSSNKMLVNGQVVNGSKVSLGEKYYLNVRAAIHQLEKARNNLSLAEFTKKYQSIFGKINRITQYNIKKGTALKKQLRKVNYNKK